jgi:hypothetical protein
LPRSADYSLMRCLYCGKELALLKRLTGGGDFCSDAHKQSYQEEYNRLALSRLLQAQKKGQQAANPPAQNGAPPPQTPVAVEEPAAAHVGISPAGAPVLEVALTEARTEAAIDSVAVDESSAEPVVESATTVGAELEALESAGFLLENPAIAAMPEDTPYLEPWLELSVGPAMSEWQLQKDAFTLSPADLLSLDWQPKASPLECPDPSADLSPMAFTGARTDPTLSLVENTNRLPAGGTIAIDIPTSAVPSETDGSLVQAVGFECTVLFADSQLLELWPTTIDFASEDSTVVVLVRSQPGGAALTLVPSEAEPEAPAEDNSPRASLEALSRLHQELAEQEAARIQETQLAVSPADSVEMVPVEVVPVEIAKAVAVEVVSRPEAPTESPETVPEIVETTAEEPKPRYASELFEISIKTFPPAKPALIGGDVLPSQSAPLLPNLKSLPLRPKIGLAPGYVPPSKASTASAPSSSTASGTKPAGTKLTPPAARPQSPSKPSASAKPAARLTQPKQPTQPATSMQSATAKAAEPRTPALPKAEATKPVAKPPASQPGQAEEASAAKPSVLEAPRKTPVPEQEQPAKPAPEQPAKQTRGQTSGKPPDQLTKDSVPSFGTAQPAKVSFAGSLKVKLGIAIVLLVVACTTYLGWGGKSSKPSNSDSAVSADGSGPSIIMGEGGWVEGWGGDPSGVHAGRQITIYRPSLKLSDYRLEFQGSIDTKSVGWVFRASDPENYYAMKLMTVSSGLSPKVALFKYLVANGRQTQVGRVPIDLTIQPDTVFSVRVDVRGPQFSTFIKGQQVDVWTDDQLKTGGVGFLNEREERGKVKSVSIRYLNGAAK